jgi:transglutaminase-like putative cysteine protease
MTARSSFDREARADVDLAHLVLARGTGVIALAAFAALHWMQLLEPAAPGRAWGAVGAALVAIAGLAGAAHTPRRAGAAAILAATALGSLALALLAGGVHAEGLAPGRWDDLAAGVARGIASLPGARVPYRGLDEWIRLVIGVGGTVLVVAAALLAFWPRRGRAPGFLGPAVVLLVAVYATPAVVVDAESEFVRGAVLALLVLAALTLERLRAPEVRAAAGLAGVAAVGALAAGPLLDADQPWWDYEHWALSAASSRSTTFQWEHDYGPLDWPRDGREIIRVKARDGLYWKADALDGFDGQRWIRVPLAASESAGAQIAGDARRIERWTQDIRVSVRNLRSRTLVAAGTPIQFTMPRRIIAPTGVASIYASQRSLRRGDVYEATVYAPQPNQPELRDAGTDYESYLRAYLAITAVLPAVGPAGHAPVYEVQPAPFDSGERHGLVLPPGSGQPPSYRADGVMEHSTLRRTWALAQRLRERASTPYDLVRRVQAHLRRDAFGYSEDPPRSAQTLEGFLFDARTGFCQQYSGAMALVLRMAGVPARVATGFTPGTFDQDDGEFVVRDFDAHSWVEVWFPGIGWVPFDPTPAASPARRQAGGERFATAAVGDVDDLTPGGASPLFSDGPSDQPLPWAQLAAGLAALLAAVGTWVAARRARPRTAVGELERALRRARRAPPPGTTLRALENTFAAPSAAGYVRALREQRFAAGGSGPSRAQRRALRSELGRGSPLRRLRAWWALPPKVH